MANFSVFAIICSLSLGGRNSTIINNAVNEAVHGWDCVVVVAAGNQDQDSCMYSPANAPLAVTVGNVDKTRQKNGNSNWGPW